MIHFGHVMSGQVKVGSSSGNMAVVNKYTWDVFEFFCNVIFVEFFVTSFIFFSNSIFLIFF